MKERTKHAYANRTKLKDAQERGITNLNSEKLYEQKRLT
jgi:hypothetical protein